MPQYAAAAGDDVAVVMDYVTLQAAAKSGMGKDSDVAAIARHAAALEH